MLKTIKKIISPTSGIEEEGAGLQPAHIYKEFNMILLDVFDQRVIPFIQPENYQNGTLYIMCSFSFMDVLNERKQFFIDKLQEKFGEEIITNVIFTIQK